jgi:hypothetical protein
MRDATETLSARMRAVKHVMCTHRSVFLYGFDSPLLWWELEKANYPLRRTDKNAARKLEQDYNRHCELNHQREDDLTRIFWNGVQIIFGQPKNQQKNLLVAWCTVCRISIGNESPNVMCSVRAREAFQAAAFPHLKLMDRKEQNPKLAKLETLGLGEFHKGDAAKGFKDAGIFKLLAVEDEPTDFLPLFSSSTSLLEVHTGSLFVGGSPKDGYLAIMDALDAGWKGFLNYTVAQKEVNAAAKEAFKEENPLPKVEPKPKKVYKPRKYSPSKVEKQMIESGKAQIQDNKLVILSEPAPVQVQDFSHLLEPITFTGLQEKLSARFDSVGIEF